VAGEDAGATLPFGCRMGICHTCVGRLRSGRIRDLRTGRFTVKRARRSAPASTRPRARSKSSFDTKRGNAMRSLIESPLTRMTSEQIDELGREFDVIHDEVFGDLGHRDPVYITSMIEMHRRMVHGQLHDLGLGLGVDC
jgi:hypothetical protein